MQTLIVKVDAANHAMYLANFLKTLPYIKSVVTKNTNDSIKPLKSADWARPGRPATEEELEQLVAEMQAQEKAGEYFTAGEVKARVAKRLKEWQKQNQK